MAELLDRVPTLILELAHRGEAVTYSWRAGCTTAGAPCQLT
jgi:hypothetical protein